MIPESKTAPVRVRFSSAAKAAQGRLGLVGCGVGRCVLVGRGVLEGFLVGCSGGVSVAVGVLFGGRSVSLGVLEGGRGVAVGVLEGGRRVAVGVLEGEMGFCVGQRVLVGEGVPMGRRLVALGLGSPAGSQLVLVGPKGLNNVGEAVRASRVAAAEIAVGEASAGAGCPLSTGPALPGWLEAVAVAVCTGRGA